MATAGDQIDRALRLLGVLAEGETPSAAESADGLTALNQMIDSWSIERLAVFTTVDQPFTWTASQSSRTIGPTGNFVGTRPVLLDPATYYVVDSISYPIALVNREQYNAITSKTATSALPQVLFVDMTHPDATMYIWPVPTQSLAFHFISVDTLDQPALLTTSLAFPPGYLRAFAYNLALELAPEFGVSPSADVRRIAMTSKRNLKRINNPEDMMSVPVALTTRGAYNIWTGY